MALATRCRKLENKKKTSQLGIRFCYGLRGEFEKKNKQKTK